MWGVREVRAGWEGRNGGFVICLCPVFASFDDLKAGAVSRFSLYLLWESVRRNARKSVTNTGLYLSRCTTQLSFHVSLRPATARPM